MSCLIIQPTAIKLFTFSTFFLGFIIQFAQEARGERGAFIWKQCDNRKTFLVSYLDVQPYPVNIPGDMEFSLNMTVLRELHESDMSIRIYWKTFLANIRIPCFFNLGSCSYQNACGLMERMIKEDWGGFMADFALQIKNILKKNSIDFTCPIMPQTIHLSKERLRMPTIPSFLRHFVGGDYLIELSALSGGKKEITFCLDMSEAK